MSPLMSARFALPWAALCLQPAVAQVMPPKPDIEPAAIAIRCELRTTRAPDAVQPVFFYLSDARRNVLETDGNSLGNVVQYSRQRIVVSKAGPDGSLRSYTFDRMVGALTITQPNLSSPPASGPREPWVLSGDCQKVDATHPRF